MVSAFLNSSGMYSSTKGKKWRMLPMISVVMPNRTSMKPMAASRFIMVVVSPFFVAKIPKHDLMLASYECRQNKLYRVYVQ